MKALLTFSKIFGNSVNLAIALASISITILILTTQLYIPLFFVAFFIYVIILVRFRLTGLITIIALSMGLINVVALPTITVMGGDFDLRDFAFAFIWLIEVIRMLYNKYSFQRNSFSVLFLMLYLIVGFSIFRSTFILDISKVDVFREFRHLMFYSIYFIGLMNIRTRSDIDVILKTIIVLSGIVSLMHIFQGVTGISIMQGRLEAATVGGDVLTNVRRVLSSGIVFAIFSFYYLILNVIFRNYIFSKKYVFLLLSLYFIMLLMTFGRMTWVSILFGAIVIVFLLDKIHLKRLLPLFIISCMLLFIILAAFPDYRTGFAQRYLSIFSSDIYQASSLSHRYTENKDALINIIENPIIGIGIGNSYRYSLWKPEFDTASTYIHDGYLYFILKFGFVITIPMVLLLFITLKQSYKISKLRNNMAFNVIGLCSLATFVRLLVANITQPDFVHYSTATLIGVILAILDCILNLSKGSNKLEQETI